MKLTDVKIKYTGGDRGWPGDVPQVRFNTEKMKKLGWQASRSSNDAVIKTIKEILPEFGIGN
jgi:UDP-glucose 4-epimerase